VYPASIRASLLDTARGLHPLPPSNGNAANAPAGKAEGNSGNIFSLLAKAGSNKPDGDSAVGMPAQQDSLSSDDTSDSVEESVDLAEEEKRREEIRNRFLEAIRASAARRQEAMEEED
jgi:hypothetical protein